MVAVGGSGWVLMMVLGFCVMSVTSSPEIKLVNVEPEEFGPSTRIENDQLLLLTNVTRLEIHCEAHFPVQWDFSGDSSPMQLNVRAFRKTGPKLSNPTFSAQIVIFRVSSSLSGSYYCRSILNPTTKFSKVHIFAQEKGYRGQDPVLLKYGQTISIPYQQDRQIVQIPCSTWDPNTKIHLYKRSKKTGKYGAVQPASAYNYDPEFGFQLNLTQLPQGEDYWGTYMCSPSLSRTFDRVYVNLLGKPDFKIEPNVQTVEIAEGDVLNLRCEAVDDNVTIRVAEGDDSRAIIKKEHSPESNTPFVATISYVNLTPDDSSEIQCIRDNKIIHTWNYRVVGQHDIKRRGIVKYHSKRTGLDWYACWSRTSKSPDLSFVQCQNPMECQIRGQCLKNANKCDPALVQLCSGGCAHSTIENQTGILQCQGDGVFQQIRQFMGVSGNYLYNSVMEAPRKEKLGIEGKHVFKLGSVGEFTCTGSTFLFAGGIQWGLKTQGNALKVLEPNSEEVLKLEEKFLPTGHVVGKVVLRINPHLSHITCFAPLWNSTDWESRTHPIYLQG